MCPPFTGITTAKEHLGRALADAAHPLPHRDVEERAEDVTSGDLDRVEAALDSKILPTSLSSSQIVS